MRVKVTKASDARALCAYVLNEKKQHQVTETADMILATNMMGQSVEQLAQELEWNAAAPRRRPVTKIAAHYSVSLTPGEQLSYKQMGAVTRQLLQEMGHDSCAYFAVQHHDQEHKHGVQHWHIVAATVNSRNEWVDDSFNKLRTRQVERSLEEQFGLVASPPRPIIEQKNLTTGEARRKERTGEVLPKEKLWLALDLATEDKPTMALLATRLKAQGIQIQLRREGDQYEGISFGVDNAVFAGGRLGRSYSFGGLQKYRTVYYDPAQDDTLQQVVNSTPTECQQKLADYEEYQWSLRELYDHHAEQSGTPEPGPGQDRAVALSAAAAGHSEQEITEMLRRGDTAQEIRYRFGQREAMDYSRQVAQAQQEIWQQQVEEHRQAQSGAHRKSQRQRQSPQWEL